MELLKSKTFLITFIFLVFFGISLIYLNSYKFYEYYSKNFDAKIKYTLFERNLFQLNFAHSFKKRTFSPDEESININLSPEDLIAFRDIYYSSFFNYENVIKDSEVGFISDNINVWRKSKLTLPDSEQKVKIKIHGTSRGPVRDSFRLIDHLRTLSTDVVKKEYIDISKGGYAFKIKIDSQDEYFNGMRRINFLSPYDDWSIVQNAMNKYISSLNVVTTYGELKKLYVNGTLVGPYLMQEQINKELLERNFQITNYASMKSNDDWNKAFYDAHIGSTDYTSFDKEQSGEPETVMIASDLLSRLYEAIEDENVEMIFKLMDIENLARIGALIKLTGSVSPLHGDNTRYIFNIATGKFQFAYRLEHSPLRLKSSVPGDFDLDKKNYINYHKIFNLLMQNQKFIDLRNRYLHRIISDENGIKKILAEEYAKNEDFLKRINWPTNHIRFKYISDIKALDHNIKTIKNYLNYSKVFVTIESDSSKSKNIKILHDSYTPSKLEKITSCENEIFLPAKQLNLNQASYSRIDGYVINKNIKTLKSPFDCISSIDVKKTYSDTTIDSSNIYINYSKKVSYFNDKGLDIFKDKLINEKVETPNGIYKKFTLLKGSYRIFKDVVFPKNSILVIESGVNLMLDRDISILVNGSLIAEGTAVNPITVSNIGDNAFGSFAVLGSEVKNDFVSLDFFRISGGNEKIINGTYFSGQASFHVVDVNIKNSIFEDSQSDDGLNVKFGAVNITDSIFRNNFGDQIDLDYTTGSVSNSSFYIDYANKQRFISDGLDVSGSIINIFNNSFVNMSDKGISVGEKSNVLIENNAINDNNMGVATKDGSDSCLKNNVFNRNKIDIAGYIKKKMYRKPNIYLSNQEYETTNIYDGKNIEDEFIFNKCENNFKLAV